MIQRLLVLAAVAISAGCAGDRARPHADGVARAALVHPGFDWRTEEAAGVHLHYLPGTWAATHAPELARDAAAALRYDLALADLSRPSQPVELFLVSSREQARQLAGRGTMGTAVPGELTTVYVADPTKRLAFRHEIMHALTLLQWGTQRTGSWLQEGVATWAGGSCHGHSVDEVAAGFLRDGTLPPLDSLAAHFWETDELHGYFTAASTVAYLARTQGPHAVRYLWMTVPAPGEHPLGANGAAIEAAWRRHLATVPPARIDPERLRRHGCEAP